MIKLRNVWRSKASVLVAALISVAGMGVVNAVPARAAGYMHLEGTACSTVGGYILQLIAVTSTESVYGTFGGSGWDVHLDMWDGDEYVNFAVKCNNNVWYYPIVHVTGYASPRWLGAI